MTFLFSDIEGSTQRWETDHEAMRAAVARHDAILRSSLEARGGYVFKTLGDAFCVAFTRPEDAVAAAVDAQRLIESEDFSTVDGIRIRVALHTGTANERDGDYFGPTVNRVSRLMSIGHGGQILLSSATRELIHGALPAGSTLIDLGSHRLRDLVEAEHVWQLAVGKGAAPLFPPLKSLDALPNNLPMQLKSFLGRERELAELRERLTQHRLVTIAGSGGVGKTRLALQSGADLLDSFPDGVWFADLALISDPELVSSVVAQVLGMSQREGARVDESIPQWLKRKNLLLILDNCEHLLEVTASLADAIIRHCPDVRVLTTSRQALGISGEEVVRLASLDVPHKIQEITPTTLLSFGAVALFVDRARAVNQAFRLDEGNAAIVTDICRRLDGIPLAIELAAARVKVLSVPNLAQRLQERFKLLTGGTRDAVARQKTLSAMMDWSFDLLTPDEQQFFTRLGIFAGGFGLEAATVICGDGADEIGALDLLSSLTDKSLVVAETSGEQERYRLLESTRAYAVDKLQGAGTLDDLARRHAAYFQDRAIAAQRRLSSMGSIFVWLADAELELDNYRAALEWSLTQGHDATLGGTIASSLRRFWIDGGLRVEGRYWTRLALEHVSEVDEPVTAARLWRALTFFSFGNERYSAAERAQRLFRQAGDEGEAMRTHDQLAFALMQLGRLDEAESAIERAIQVIGQIDDAAAVAETLSAQAAIMLDREKPDRARKAHAEALAAFRAIGDEFGTGRVLSNLAEVEFAAGNVDLAIRYGDEAEAIRLQGKPSSTLANTLVNNAAYRIAVGEIESGRELAQRGVRLALEQQDALLSSFGLQHLALIGALNGRSRIAATLLGYVDARMVAAGVVREPTEQWGYDTAMKALREHLGDDEIKGAHAEGEAWSEDRAAEEALKL